jgi:hypothetical protein
VRRIVQRLGAALDLQRIDADLHQPLDVLDRAQVLRIHDADAALVQGRHQLARPLGLLDQVGTVGQRMARLLVQRRVAVVGLLQRLMGLQRHHLYRARVAAGVLGSVLDHSSHCRNLIRKPGL